MFLTKGQMLDTYDIVGGAGTFKSWGLVGGLYVIEEAALRRVLTELL